MPELSKDVFGDPMARAAFYLREALQDDLHLAPQPNLFCGLPHARMLKPSQESYQFWGTPTNDLEAFMFATTPRPNLCPPDSDEQMFGYGTGLQFSTFPANNHPLPPQIEDHGPLPLPDECTWMSEVLDDLPPITEESPPFSGAAPDISLNISQGGAYPSDILSVSLAAPPNAELDSPMEEAAAVSATTSTPPRTLGAAIIPRAPPTSDDATSKLSPVPKPLKRRAGGGPKKASNNKWSANMEQLDHVRRERQRRDDMSSKISTLECLLPSAPNLKRDRASVVHDSVHYVKSLQQRVEDLKRTYSDLQQLKSSSSSSRKILVTEATRSDHVGSMDLDIRPSSSSKQVGGHGAQGREHTNILSKDRETGRNNNCSGKSRLVEYHVQVEGGGEAATLEKCICRADYMSSSLKVLDELNLELCRCNVTKMFDHTICVIVAKPRLTSIKAAPAASSSSVLATLRSAVEL